MAYDVSAVERYIRQAAAARGMDPDIAVKAARSEGLARNTWQSNIVHPTRGREPSYGPFQMLVGGQNGWPTGLGNAFQRDTGLDPSDPTNVYKTVDYALDTVAKEGWQQWYGPAKVGIGRWDGVKGAQPLGAQAIAQAPVGIGAASAQQLPAPQQAPGTPAPALGPGVNVADRPIAPIEGVPPGIMAQLQQLTPPTPTQMTDTGQGGFMDPSNPMTAIMGLLAQQNQEEPQPVQMAPAMVGGGNFQGLPQMPSLLPSPRRRMA